MSGHGHCASGSCSHGHMHTHDHGGSEESRRRDIILIASGIAAFILVGAFKSGFPSESEGLLYLVPYLILGFGVLRAAVVNIFSGNFFDEQFLMGVATIGALVLGEYTEAVAVMLFYRVGELFQDMAVDNSRRSIAAIVDIKPEFAVVLDGEERITKSPEEVAPGETILVLPGERVPLDGIIVFGSTDVDSSALTGESLPVYALKGDEVAAGSINLTGVIHLKVLRPFGESAVSRILNLITESSERKARAERFITKFAKYYTPAVIVFALAVAFIPPLAGFGSLSMWIGRALIFLVVSCPCALVISVPLTFFAGMGAASRKGILIKGGNFMESLAEARSVIFDKTGTLTSGKFRIDVLHPSWVSEEELLRVAALAESSSNHPIALSICEAAGEIGDMSSVTSQREIAGYGVEAEIDGLRVLVGSLALMEENGISVFMDCGCRKGVHVARGGVYLGHISVADSIKEDSYSAVERLRASGISDIIMFTGDDAGPSEDVADKLGIEDVRSNMLPEDKVGAIESIIEGGEDRGSTVFVGDGINDAPVLARADVGIAMGALGSDAAVEAADVVLVEDRPSAVVDAIEISRKAMTIVRQNIFLAIGVKFGVMALATFGFANMWMAVFADVGVALLAVLNAMRCLKV